MNGSHVTWRSRSLALAACACVGMLACGGAKKQVVSTDGDFSAPAIDWRALSGADGIIFAETVGETVDMRALELGETVALNDGDPVTLDSVIASIGIGRAEARITAAGVVGIVENPRVLTGDRLTKTSLDGHYLFRARRHCDEGGCVSELWLLEYGRQRMKLSDTARDTLSVAVSPDGTQLAIGSGGLVVVDLGDWTVRRDPAFTSPAFAPNDGALYVRAVGRGDDGVYEVDDTGMAALILSRPGEPEDPNAPPAPVRFEMNDTVLVADFVREDGTQTMRQAR